MLDGLIIVRFLDLILVSRPPFYMHMTVSIRTCGGGGEILAGGDMATMDRLGMLFSLRMGADLLMVLLWQEGACVHVWLGLTMLLSLMADLTVVCVGELPKRFIDRGCCSPQMG